MHSKPIPSHASFIDLTGRKIGRFTVLSYAGKASPTNGLWNCICDCGKTITTQRGNLFRKNASCGCFRRENNAIIKRTHGMRRSRAYRIWANMKTRCKNPKTNRRHIYLDRGINYDPKWEQFAGFWDDMKDGYTDTLTLERKNNDLGYSKQNCKWATYKEQNNNRRNNVKNCLPPAPAPGAQEAP